MRLDPCPEPEDQELENLRAAWRREREEGADPVKEEDDDDDLG